MKKSANRKTARTGTTKTTAGPIDISTQELKAIAGGYKPTGMDAYDAEENAGRDGKRPNGTPSLLDALGLTKKSQVGSPVPGSGQPINNSSRKSVWTDPKIATPIADKFMKK